MEENEKPGMYLRKSDRGGFYFFNLKKTYIYFMSGKHVKELIAGERDFVCIAKQKMLKENE